jgi:hypothetical protein
MTVLDVFGIREIYPTNRHPNRAKPWVMGKDDWLERRYNGWGDWDNWSTLQVDNYVMLAFTNYGSILHPEPGKGRFPVLALRFLDYYDDTSYVSYVTDQKTLAKRGFMATKQDWKNVEITMYFRIGAQKIDDTFAAMAFSVRGGPHHSDDCTGTALYVQISFEGVVHITKELGKSTYVAEDKNSGESVAQPFEHWIGMKGVFYTKANGNPYIELWIDKDPVNNLNDWKLIIPKEDCGGWLLEANNDCGGANDEKITWGGPGVIFKIAHLPVVAMKWGTIREILPPEGWPVRYLLNARGVSPPYSMRSLSQEYGLTPPTSMRELTELEAERYPFS